MNAVPTEDTPATEQVASRKSKYPPLTERIPVGTGNVAIDSYVVHAISLTYRAAVRIGRTVASDGLDSALALIGELKPDSLVSSSARHVYSLLFQASVSLGFGWGMKSSRGDSDPKLKTAMYRCMTNASILLVEAMLLVDTGSQVLVRELARESAGFGTQDPGTRNEWHGACRGAMAVVHAVQALQSTGLFTVFLPTVMEDMVNKIDLIAQVTDRDFGIVFQIKSRYQGETRCRIVHKAEHDGTDDHLLVKGTEKFMDGVDGFWVPVHLEVRSDDIYTAPVHQEVATALMDMMLCTA